MCSLRYEHEFYVQSRKRFPKEGKIVVTGVGEEKVVSIDIFHESVTLRNVEGDVRTIALADFKRETEEASGVPATAAVEEEDVAIETIRPEEISPDLMYTAEHQIPQRNNVVPELTGADTVATGNSGLREGDTSNRRRRGRRGGRRGRGSDDSSSGSA
jgi:hypothetical protein